MLTEAELQWWDEKLEAEVEKNGRWNPNWLPSHIAQHIAQLASSATPKDLPPVPCRLEDEFPVDLPWYKLYQPGYRPEDPAIEEMREKLRQQQCDEEAPPRFLITSTESSRELSESLLELKSIYGQTFHPLGSSNTKAQENSFSGGIELQQMNDVEASLAQHRFKRKADSPPSIHKRRKMVADDINSNNPSSPYHILDDTKSLAQSAGDTAPRRAGVLARDVGQEVRRRAKTSGRKRTKGTVTTNIQPTEALQVADITNQELERAAPIDAISKTVSKSPKKPAGNILRNPSVVIYRDSGLQMPKAGLPSNGHDLGGNTGQDRRHTNAPHPRTQKEKKLREKKDCQPPLNTKGRVSKLSTSNPGRKRSRKTTIDPSRKTNPPWTRSNAESHNTKHVALNKKNKPVPVLSATQDVKLIDHEDHMVHGGNRSIFG